MEQNQRRWERGWGTGGCKKSEKAQHVIERVGHQERCRKDREFCGR